jgi:arginine decarboxylase-like protein
MADPDMTFIKEMLTRIQEEQRSFRAEVREQYVRLGGQVSSLEGGMGLVLHYAGDRAQQDASVNQRFDAMQQKIHQLEDMINQMRNTQ